MAEFLYWCKKCNWNFKKFDYDKQEWVDCSEDEGEEYPNTVLKTTQSGCKTLFCPECDKEVEVGRYYDAPPSLKIHNVDFGYQGKRKKIVERMREEKNRRIATGKSIPELCAEHKIGTYYRAIDANTGKEEIAFQPLKDDVVSNEKWEKMEPEAKAKAEHFGIHPSKHYEA